MDEPEEHDADVKAACAEINLILHYGFFGFYIQEAVAAGERAKKIIYNLEKSCHALEAKNGRT